MAHAVYRGVSYDTELRRQSQSQEKQSKSYNETYRGVKFIRIEGNKL
jgi:hypothetical protein